MNGSMELDQIFAELIVTNSLEFDILTNKLKHMIKPNYEFTTYNKSDDYLAIRIEMNNHNIKKCVIELTKTCLKLVVWLIDYDNYKKYNYEECFTEKNVFERQFKCIDDVINELNNLDFYLPYICIKKACIL